MDWAKTLADSGVAIGVLVMLLLGLWRVLVWAANHVVLPVVNSHINFLQAASESLSRQKEALVHLSEQISSLRQLLEQQRAWMSQHETNVQKLFRAELKIHDDKIAAEGRVCPMADKCPMRENREAKP